MPSSRRLLAALFIVALLCGPAAAVAQTTTSSSTLSATPSTTQTTTTATPSPDDPASVSPQAPVQLDDGSGESSGDLPNTGTDPRLLFLAGLALTLLGAGLRLRTADADLY